MERPRGGGVHAEGTTREIGEEARPRNRLQS
jgi:hypothetical protein